MVYLPAGVTAPEPPPGPPGEGINRPEPHPLATSSTHTIAAASFLRRKAMTPSGASSVVQRMLPCGEDTDAEPDTPVSTVTETVVALPSTATLNGATLQVELAGAPEHERVTVVPATAGPEVKSSGKTAFFPLAVVSDDGPFVASVKSTPCPVSDIVCGEAGAVSEIVNEPPRAPPAVGRKASCMVQASPTASVLPQVLLPGTMAKSPLTATVAMERGRPPLFVRVTVCGAELSETPVAGKFIPNNGDNDTPGGATPVPLNVTVCERY